MLRTRYNHFRLGTRSRLLVSILPSLIDTSFERALASQPAMEDLQQPIFIYIGAILFLLGNTFVLSSMYALGITGTYLGNLPPKTPQSLLLIYSR